MESYIFAIQNMLITAKIRLGELFQFGFCLWWWQLWIYGNLLYLFDSPYRLFRREFTEITKYKKENYGYGETFPSTLKTLLEDLVSEGFDRFIDLGSGRGFAVIAVNRLFDIWAEGWEILPSHVKRGQYMKKLMKLDKVNFYEQDIAEGLYNQKAIYFSAATAFEEKLMNRVRQRLKEIPEDSVAVIINRTLPKPWFEQFRKERADFSWGWDTVRFYRRTFYR